LLGPSLYQDAFRIIICQLKQKTQEDEMSFNPGDVVQMKSGGPLMTVVSFEGGSYVCSWMERSGPQSSPKYAKKKELFTEIELVKSGRGPMTVGFA
jgi:uncharacterized protein YodC (DUF2158 family)